MGEREGKRTLDITISDQDFRRLDGIAAENNTDVAGITKDSLRIGVAIMRMMTEGGTLLLKRGPDAEPVKLEFQR